jgi:hypothetical protein
MIAHRFFNLQPNTLSRERFSLWMARAAGDSQAATAPLRRASEQLRDAGL